MRPTTFEHHQSGRSVRAVTTLLSLWALLAGLIITINLSPVIAAIVALFTLPALWDIVANPQMRLRLGPSGLGWGRPGNIRTIPLDQISEVRFETRFDLSARATVIRKNGRKLRLPPPALPPRQSFEAALSELGVKTTHNPFFLI